jgi:hypothetical protein
VYICVWRYPVNFSVHYNIHYITFTILVRETWNDYPLSAQKWLFFPRVMQIQYIQNLQTSQGYIFLILQQFATKLCNFTHFRTLFPAMVLDFILLVLSKTEWKFANIAPVFKIEDLLIEYNYRPISLRCVLSKVLERCNF